MRAEIPTTGAIPHVRVAAPLRLTGAKELKKGELQARSLAFGEGIITKAPPSEVDLSGYWILPGIVDLHGDAIERHLAPRPSAPFAKETVSPARTAISQQTV